MLRFLEAILDCMQNWVDNTQLRVPGYRDRVAHISLAADEGGLNLDMPAELVERLVGRGGVAGSRLSCRFTGRDTESVLDWDNHRWVRYRSTMTLLEDYLLRLRRAYERPAEDGLAPYAGLVRRPDGAAPPPGAEGKNLVEAVEQAGPLLLLNEPFELRAVGGEGGVGEPGAEEVEGACPKGGVGRYSRETGLRLGQQVHVELRPNVASGAA